MAFLGSLNRLKSVRRLAVSLKRLYLTRVWGMDLDPTCDFSLSTRFDKTHPGGVHVGAQTYIAFDAAILTHDMIRAMHVHTRIGTRCFIGARSIILPGVSIGDGCVVGAGSVVTTDVPPGSLVAGNPAKVLRTGITTHAYGRMRYVPETRAAPAA